MCWGLAEYSFPAGRVILKSLSTSFSSSLGSPYTDLSHKHEFFPSCSFSSELL